MTLLDGNPGGTAPKGRLSGPYVGAPARLSHGQERLLFLDSVAPASPAQHVAFGHRLIGHLDIVALRAAFLAVVRRHEVLRTTFVAENGEVTPKVCQEAVSFVEDDLSMLSRGEQEVQLRERSRADATLPFEIDRRPPVRARLVRLNAEEHVFLVSVHHLIFDGMSEIVLYRELDALYTAIRDGRGAALDPLPFQYSDYAAWERQRLASESVAEQLTYWKRRLDGADHQLELPYRRTESLSPSGRGAKALVDLDADLSRRLREIASSRGATLFMFLLASIRALLYRYTHQSDFCIAVPVSVRPSDARDLIGYFVNTLAMRTHVHGRMRFLDLLADERRGAFDAFQHREAPFGGVVQAVAPARQVGVHPLVQVSLNHHNMATDSMCVGDVKREPYWRNGEIAPAPLVIQTRDTLDSLTFIYDQALFDQNVIERMLGHFHELLLAVARDPEVRIAEIPLRDVPMRRRSDGKEPLEVRVSATFTADLLAAPLAHWLGEAGLPANVRFGGYGQLFQDLLNPAGLQAERGGIGVALLRLEDWLRDREVDEKERAALLRERGDELVRVVRASRRHVEAPMIVGLCPVFDHALEASGKPLHESLAAELGSIPGVYPVFLDQAASAYGVSEVYDRAGDSSGHIPYSEGMFAAMGAWLSRKIHALLSAPYKVLVLDADNTLWRGVCGEDGAEGVVLDEASLAVQRFALAKRSEGMLLALCSKNEPEDVNEVFATRTEMELQWSDLVAHRINWRRKSDSLMELAAELNVGLDSLVFVDDNPAECAEVRAHCSGVLVVELPGEREEIPSFLAHVWGLDRLKVTDEDRQRSAMYQQDKERSHERTKVTTLEEFLASLELEVEVKDLSSDRIERVAQLAARTNQFNVTAIPRQAAEFERLWRSGELECRTVEAQDRFGSYGLVGTCLFAKEGERLRIDTLLLSCRVLGKKVEHALIEELASLAEERGCTSLEIPYRRTAKNTPARLFLESLGGQVGETDDGFIVTLPVALARRAREASSAPAPVETSEPEGAKARAALVRPATPEQLLELARSCRRVEDLLAALDVRVARSVRQTYVAPRTETERVLADIWSAVLKVERVGIHDDFFALGGDSIMCVQVASRAQATGLGVTVQRVLEYRTVAALAAKANDVSTTDEIAAEPFALSELSEAELARGLETGDPVGPAGVEDVYPLSPLQAGLLYHSLLGDSYVVQLQLVLEGGRERALALRSSFERLMDRHPVFRTRVSWEGVRTPHQVVYEPNRCRLPWVELDWRNGNGEPAETRARLEAFAENDLRSGMDLSRAPLFRVTLIRTTSETWHVFFSQHHLIHDGWSIALVLRDVVEGYREALLGETAERAVPPPYRHYLAWLASRDRADSASYWRARLAGFHQPTPLGGDRHVGPASDPVYETQPFQMPAAISDALHSLARERQVTMSTLIHAAWAHLLSRYSGSRDVVFGSVTSGRPPELRGSEEMVGLFLNTVPVRVVHRSGETVAAYVARLQAELWGQRSHEHVPLADIQKWSAVPTGRPLFESLVVFENQPVGAGLEAMREAAPGLSVVRWREHTHYPLALVVTDVGTLSFRVDYDARRFEHRAIDRLARHFIALLRGLAASSDGRIEDVDILPPAERQQLLVAWNDASRVVPEPHLLHGRFEEVATCSPEAVAVVVGERVWSYGALDALADAWARQLQDAGVSRGTRVSVCFERSFEMVVGLYAVLKAGAAYVPLDPSLPSERLEYMALQAGVAAMLCHEATREIVAPLGLVHGIPVLVTDDMDATGVPRPVQLTGEDLAYVIFTSGSTGRPKGVAIRHGSVVNLLASVAKVPGMTSSDALLAVTTISFDISVLELFLPLSVGARVVVATRDEIRDPRRLIELMSTSEITHMQATPSMWSMLLDAGWTGCALRALCGGEALPLPLADRLTTHGAELWNMYGPTETTIWSSAEPMSAGSPVSLGRPLDNTCLYVRDQSLRPVPTGVAGELLIGGLGLARGYWRRPGLTSATFIPDPFSKLPGSRMYRTGDVARWRADGGLEYLGRIDRQVKIRGHRIELGEIEAVLLEHDGVVDAVVTATAESARDMSGAHASAASSDTTRRLVAYVVPATRSGAVEGRGPSVAELRDHLEVRLPEYMVPAAFVVLKALPLTSSGKIDHKALPAPDDEAFERREFVAPRTAAEQTLANIWSEILMVERVGIHDSFFDLGGHSLMTVRLAIEVSRSLGVSVAISEIFAHPTVARLSAFIVQRAPSQMVAEVGLRATGLTSAPATATQRAYWLMNALNPHNALLLTPFAWRLVGTLDVEALRAALQDMLLAHSILRTRFRDVDGVLMQHVVPEDELPGDVMETYDLRTLAREERSARRDELVLTATTRVMDLSSGSLVRITLIRTDDDVHELLVVLHHLGTDFASTASLLRDLQALYASRVSEASAAPSFSGGLQYIDYADFVARHAASPTGRAEVDYWRDCLRDALPLDLPVDVDRSAVDTLRDTAPLGLQMFDVYEVTTDLSREGRIRLIRMAQEANTTLMAVTLAGWVGALHRLTGQEDICIQSTFSHRYYPGLERTSGVVGNALIMRVDASGGSDLETLVDRTSRVVAEAYDHDLVGVTSLAPHGLKRCNFNFNRVARAIGGIAEEHAVAGRGFETGGALFTAPMDVPRGRLQVPFDVHLVVVDFLDGIHITLHGSRALFHEETCRHMLTVFEQVLDGTLLPMRALETANEGA